MRLVALLMFASWSAFATTQTSVLTSTFATANLPLDTNPASEIWANAPRVTLDRDYFGNPIPGPPTEVRSRWTKAHLYLLYICPYDELNLKPNPDISAETPRLWNWDVAEVFIGSDFEHITRYKELQVSPQAEWVDLDIDRDNPNGQAGAKWNSGMSVAARVDSQAKVWYGVMRIPFAAIDPRLPEKGRELRAGLYRIAGAGDAKKHYAWRPTNQTSFHVPSAFGTIRLE